MKKYKIKHSTTEERPTHTYRYISGVIYKTAILISVLVSSLNVHSQRYTTVLPTNDGSVGNGAGYDSVTLRISANSDKVETSRILLKFDVTNLPVNARIASINLRLYTNTIADTRNFQLVSIYQGSNSDWKPATASWSNPAINPTSFSKAEIETSGGTNFRLNNFQPAGIFTLVAQSPAKSQNNTFYSATGSESPTRYSNKPKLILSYDVSPTTSRTDWAQYKNGAQHQGNISFGSNTKITELQRRIIYGGPSSYLVGGATTQPLIIYKDNPVVFEQTTANGGPYFIARLNSAGGIIWKTGTEGPCKFSPLVDENGRMYYVTQNKLIIYDLENNCTVLRSIQLSQLLNGTSSINVTRELTLGYNNALYIPTSEGIYAITAYPQLRILWKYEYSASDRVGPVSLSPDERVAYLIKVNSSNGELLALDNSDGSLLAVAEQKLKRYVNDGINYYIPAPVVADNSKLFVLNGFNAGSELFLFEFNLSAKRFSLEKELNSTQGTDARDNTGLSQPVIDNKGMAYFVYKNKMAAFNVNTKSWADTSQTITLDNASTLLTNASSQVFALDAVNNKLQGYVYTNKFENTFNWNRTDAVNFKSNIVVSPSGVLYSVNDNVLMAFTPKQLDIASATLTSIDPNQVYRASQALSVNGVRVLSSVNAVIYSGGTVSFKPGFSVQQGAQLSIKTGY